MASKVVFEYGKCHYNTVLIWKQFVRWLGYLELRAQKLQIKCLHTLQHWLFCLEKPHFSLFPLMYMKLKSAKVFLSCLFFLVRRHLAFWSPEGLDIKFKPMNSSRPIFLICRAWIMTFNHVVVLWELWNLTHERNLMEFDVQEVFFNSSSFLFPAWGRSSIVVHLHLLPGADWKQES